MYQGFSGDFDSASRCSSSPSEPQYLSSVDSFSQSIGSPTTAAQLTAEEEEKRRVRRERNKLAAAKCRNRRRELTDRLQTETDQLEEEKAELQSQIAELHKEKERLEFVLVAHKPACKIPFQDPLSPQPSAASAEVSSLGLPITLDGKEPPLTGSYPSGYQLPAEVPFSSPFYPPCETVQSFLNTSPNASYTSSFVFTYPEGSSCGLVHQRNSSSDQSSDSLNSPSLLAL
ncbi:protein fosB isoform X3 [Pristis pectinata]|uniref:protein fosB isoform X3 n=1 Tax=Pristis pectinata TaxID=685728 RepID=UPI00223D8A9C|nr:protein fosB isoform X3 [Pristis pectinata]